MCFIPCLMESNLGKGEKGPNTVPASKRSLPFLSQWCHLVVIRKKCLNQCAASVPQPHAQEMSSFSLHLSQL